MRRPTWFVRSLKGAERCTELAQVNGNEAAPTRPASGPSSIRWLCPCLRPSRHPVGATLVQFAGLLRPVTCAGRPRRRRGGAAGVRRADRSGRVQLKRKKVGRACAIRRGPTPRDTGRRCWTSPIAEDLSAVHGLLRDRPRPGPPAVERASAAPRPCQRSAPRRLG